MKTSPAPRVLLLAATCAAFLAGCAGPNTKATTGVAATEYEQVYALGSYIPVLVPKGSGARQIHPTSPAVIIQQDDIQRALGNGSRLMH
ncbi:MAG TPA: hypothetical protein VM029_07995 [Opitutaceae bacterium]|nr:hypothetical protein [Opitutaceae bacterium]